MTYTAQVDIRATVCAIGGIVLGVLAVATVAVPLTALAVIDDSTIKAIAATVSLPLALVGLVLALGTAYLAVAGWGSTHAVTAGVLFLLAFAGAIAIVVAAGSADKYSGVGAGRVSTELVLHSTGGGLSPAMSNLAPNGSAIGSKTTASAIVIS